jgi:hypothetical protein
MTNTPETDELRDDIWASVYVDGQDFMHMLEHARKMERERDAAQEEIEMLGIRYAAAEMHHATNMQEVTEQRDRMAEALILDWQTGPYPDTMRVVLATDGESMYVATYTKDDGWQDAHTCEDIDYYITYWAEMPALPQV